MQLTRLQADYEILFCGKVQDLVIRRKKMGITQFQMSRKLGKSLSTIQNFERYGCKDAFILFGYKRILN